MGVYLRRRRIEPLVKGLKGVMGLGQCQVTSQVSRVERSVARAMTACLLLLKLHAQGLPADRASSAFRLPRAFAWGVRQVQCGRSARQLPRKWLQLGNAA